MSYSRPPGWMTAWLQTVVSARDQEVIAGDLIEEYREVVLPTKGLLRAHIWYAVQVVGFVRQAEWFLLRSCGIWLILLVAAIPVFVPGAVAIFLTGIPCCGFFVARRSVLLWAGTFAAFLLAAAMFATILSIVFALGLRHPPLTNLFAPALAAAVLGSVSAFAGRCSGERMQELVFPRI